MTSSKKVRRVGLMGPFGYGNLGDAATQDAMIQHVRERFPEAQIFGFSLNPKDTEARHGIKSFPISWQSWEKKEGRDPNAAERLAEWLTAMDRPTPRQLARLILRAPREIGLVRDAFSQLRSVDVLIVSGGGQLEDYWGHGPWSYPYTFLKWCVVAKLIGVRVFLVSVGAGPITAELSKRFLRWGLALTEYRSYRDDFSLRLIEHIGFDRQDPIYPDLAFSLDMSRAAPAERPSGVERVVVVGPVGYFKKGCWPEHDEQIYRQYLQKMASFVKWLLAKNHAVVFLPGEVHYDQLVIGDLLECLGGLDADPLRLHRPSVTAVPELLSQLKSADIAVSSRFHILLLSQALGKPAIGLSYQEKIDALMATAGQSENCFPVGGFELEQLKERFLAIEGGYDATRGRIVEWSSRERTKLDDQYQRVFGAMTGETQSFESAAGREPA